LPSWSQKPSAHGSDWLSPPAQYSPGLQGSHWSTSPSNFTVPAGQLAAGKQPDQSGPAELVPAGQALQARSAALLGMFDTNVPGAQSLHTTQASALFIVLKLPLLQAAQMRSLSSVGALLTYWPGLHVVYVTQAVSGRPSSSNVPSAQGATPPSVPFNTVLEGPASTPLSTRSTWISQAPVSITAHR
jgi:hypothetical protein